MGAVLSPPAQTTVLSGSSQPMVPLSLTFLLLMSFPSPVKPALLKGSAFSRLYLCLISRPVTPSKTRYTLSLVKRTLERQDRTLPTWCQPWCFTPFPGGESVLLIALLGTTTILLPYLFLAPLKWAACLPIFWPLGPPAAASFSPPFPRAL